MIETLTVPPAVIVLIATVAVAVLPRKLGHAAGVLSLLWVAVIALFHDHGTFFQYTVFGVFDVALFVVDDFTASIGFVFGVLGAAAVLYAYASETPKFTSAIALSYVASTLGVVFAGDWLSLIFFWELMAVTSTVLVWRYGGEAVRAGYRYAVFHGIGGSLFLFAVIWHYAVTGSMLFGGSGFATGWPLILAVLGIGVNCGFVGLHTWLPDTYPRPHFAASVFLSVYTTKTGAYVLYRTLPQGEMALAIAYMGGLMAVYGVVFALLQHDMRALLSYHIQAQVGYMIAGIGIGLYIGGEVLNVGVGGAIGHLTNNILFKSLLFMAVGVIIYRTGQNDLYKLGGLWRVMPLTFAAFLVGALSITAIPGFNGFISKGMILDAAHPKYFGGGSEPLYWMLKIGAVGTFLSFIKLGYYAFFHGPVSDKIQNNVRDATRGQTLGMATLSVFCLLFGVWWTGFTGMLPFVDPASLTPYSAGHLTDALLLGTISFIGFFIIRKPLSSMGHIHDVDVVLYRETFYLTKYVTYLVTDSFKQVDRMGVSSVRTVYWIGANPVQAVEDLRNMLPAFLAGLLPEQGESPSRAYLRPGIGTSILILTGVLTVILILVL